MAFRLIGITLSVFAICVTSLEPLTETWQRMIEQDPRATGILHYCESINIRSIEECRVKFFDGPLAYCERQRNTNPDTFSELESTSCAEDFAAALENNTVPPQSIVALKAAAFCLEQQGLSEDPSLTKMFGIDMATMSMFSNPYKDTTPVPRGLVKDANGDWVEYRYTIAERREAAAAAEKGFEEHTKWVAEVAAIGLPVIGAIAGGKGGAKLGKEVGAVLGEIAGVLSKYVGGQFRFWEGYGHPELMGKSPWKCSADTENCSKVVDDKLIEVSKEFLDNQDLEFLKKDHGDSKPEDRGNDEQDTPGANKPDQPDEDKSTTTMLDGTERTSLERCAEKEERRLWRQISITTIDQDSPTEDERKEEAAKQLELGFCDKSFYGIEYCRQWEFERSLETPFPPDLSEDERRRAEAESNLRGGICDLLFYGEAYCRAWKLGLDERETEFAPEDVQTVNTFSPFCPENVVTRESCENMRLEFHENFMTSDSVEVAVNTLFTPSPPIEGQLPNIDQLLVELQVNSERRTGTEPGEGNRILRRRQLAMRGGIKIPPKPLNLVRAVRDGTRGQTARFGSRLRRVSKPTKRQYDIHNEL